jgi:hypothetical protein
MRGKGRKRFYIYTERGTFRLPAKIHREIVSQQTELAQFAKTSQRIVEASYFQGVLSTHSYTFAFDRRGLLDLAPFAEAAALALSGDKPKAIDNVIDVRGLLKTRAWNERHAWKAPRAVLTEILHDMEGTRTISAMHLERPNNRTRRKHR